MDLNEQNLFSLIYGSAEPGSKLADLLRNAPFDEQIEIDPVADTIRNIYHTPNKYAIPILNGSFSSTLQFAATNFVHPEDQNAYHDFWDPSTWEERAAAEPFPGTMEGSFRLLMASGHYNWCRYIVIHGEENGVPAGKWYVYLFDIHNQKRRVKNSQQLDPLTKLHRSEDFFHLAAQRYEPGRDYCCLAITIGQFPLFNSIYGRDKGDQLLASFGDILRSNTLAWDAEAAYFGQIRFAVFGEYSSKWINQLYDTLKCAVITTGNTVRFTPAIGIYRLENGERPELYMFDKALIAMEEAKQNLSNRIVEYTLTTYHQEQEEYQLLIDLQKAIAEDRLEFYVQPQCRMSTGRIIGGEALIRWKGEDGRIIPPGSFIPILEKNGFIADIDRIVWEKVCVWLRSLMDRGIAPVPISINISQMDILSMDVVSYLYNLVQKYRIPVHLVKVEITESFYAEKAELVQGFVKELSQKGFTTLMDDFGSGYSSLNMLETLTVDILKLDMAFMRHSSARTRKGVTIVESIINMAKMMGLPIIIEGVETKQQVQFLTDLGCRYAQGYYFFRPMPVAEFEMLLADTTMIDHRGIIGKANEQFHVREFLDENTFTDAILNNILGAVAFYSFDGKDLTINRFNQQFYRSIADAKMENRKQGIQNYVLEEDRPTLYRTLEEATRNPAVGSSCEIRFYKSDGNIFWFHMHLFHLKNEDQKQIFYGQIRDVTELRQQSYELFEVLRQQSKLCMRINLSQETIQYIRSENSLMQPDLPSMELSVSMTRTAQNRIPIEADVPRFLEFFDTERLRETHRKGIYHETLNMSFLWDSIPHRVEFSTYYIRYSLEEDLNLYVFVKDLE